MYSGLLICKYQVDQKCAHAALTRRVNEGPWAVDLRRFCVVKIFVCYNSIGAL